MPVLQILTQDGELSPLAYAEVIAVSMYPDDEQKRRQLAANLATRLMLEIPDWQTKFPSAIGLVPILYNSPEPEEVIRRMAKHAGSSWIAGKILLTLLSAATHHPEIHAIPTKVIAVLPEILSGVTTLSGDPIVKQPRSIWGTWSAFKSVSHLQALRLNYPPDAEESPSLEFSNYVDRLADNLLEHLGVAESLRLRGVELRFLKDEETWRSPPELKLPTVRMELPPLDEALLEALRNYTPEY